MSESADAGPQTKADDGIILAADALVKDYQIGRVSLRVLHGVDVQVRRGELLSIVGPSGAGKSTLLHLLGMLDTPTEGRVLHRGRDVAELSPARQAYWRNRLFGFVFQFYHLLPDFTALENVALPSLVGSGVVGWRGRAQEARQRAREMLEMVGLGERARHRPGQLSGGERQRVAIARALVNRPEVLFCDEPTGNLDSDTGAAILELLQDVQRETGCTLVVVTHDEHIANVGERVVRLQDGRIVA
ncbi:MAG: ABC transporter ATP-binding protein [Planctomycetota bacterium]